MNRDKRIHQLSKKLVELSRDESGSITSDKVSEVLTGFKQVGDRDHLQVLKAYQTRIRQAVAQQTAVVESASELSEDALASIESTFSKKYDRPIAAQLAINPALIAGVRVKVGDDVYDSSVAGRLERLAASVR